MPPTGGPERTLARRRSLGGRNRDLVPGERSSTRSVAHVSAASACTVKFFARVLAPDDRGRHRTQPSAGSPGGFADAVLQGGGRGT
jgi:hypothetical protein